MKKILPLSVGDQVALVCTGSICESKAETIVFCGVKFMAESAKILSPKKTVLLPEATAGCPMADSISPRDVKALKAEHKGAAAVCYINTSAGVKAECDICCTSSNAINIVRGLPEKDIIFVPDINLGKYVQKQVPEKNISQLQLH